MKVGVLGTGFGAYHVELLSKMEEVDAIYVFGRKPEKLKELQIKFGVNTVTDINEIMENDEIDLVDICLPTELHSKYGIQALEHGKHVFCEIPVAYSMEDAIAMQKAKEKAGKQLMVDLILRFDSAYEALTDMTKNSEYGSIRKIQIQRNTPPIWGDLGPKKIVTDLMIHDIDFVSSLLGSPRQIHTMHTLGVEGQCAVSALCSYEEAFAEINASSMMPYGYPFAVSYEVIFEHAVARYYFDGYQDHVDTKLTIFTENKITKPTVVESSCQDKALRYAAKMIQTSDKPINDISEALVSLKMVTAIKEQILQN